MFVKNNKRLKAIKRRGAKFIDMRTPIEYRDSPVPNTTNMPFQQLCGKLMGFDRKEEIVLFAGDSNSPELAMALEYAHRLGFEKVFGATIEDVREAS